MGDIEGRVAAGDAALAEGVDRKGLRLGEDRDQQVRPGHLRLTGALNVEERPLEHAADPEGLVDRRGVGLLRERLHLLGHEPLERPADPVDVGAAGEEHLTGARIVEEREEEVL